MGEVNFANVIDSYIGAIKSDLGKFSGRVFWTGKDLTFVNIPMGKSIVSLVARGMAKFLHKEDINTQQLYFSFSKKEFCNSGGG